jgi:hypothetical protein
MAKQADGCVQAAAGPIQSAEGKEMVQLEQSSQREKPEMVARVGGVAPDFEAVAYADGAFKKIKLSDYKGQWVALCFYPGDFTFV